MTMTSTRWLASVAVMASLALATPVSAQRDGGTAPAPAPARPQGEPAPQRPAGDPAAKREAQAGAPAAAPVRAGGMTRDEMVAKFASEEAAHRERAAKIARLRELAQAEGKKDRLDQIAALERKENERYAAMTAKARSVMGEDEFRKVDEKLNKGRRRAQAAHEGNAERKADKDAGNDPARERKQAQGEKPGQQPKRDGGAPPATERPKQGGERPKTDNAPAPGRGSNPRSL